MKKCLLLLLTVCLVVVLCACGGSKQETQSVPQQTEQPTPVPTKSPETMYAELMGTYPNDGSVGSYQMDLDGDGIKELFVGPLVGDLYERQIIYAMYTVSNGEVVKVFESTDNDKYYLTDNGTVAEENIKSTYEAKYSYYTYANGELRFMVAVGFSMAMNKQNPWYEEEAGEQVPLEESTAIDFIQVYQSTYRNLEYN